MYTSFFVPKKERIHEITNSHCNRSPDMPSKDNTKKALLVTTISGFVPQFEMNNVHILQEMGYEIHYASNFNNVHYGSDNHRLDGTGIIKHQVDFVRSPFKLKANYKAYKQLKQVMSEEHYDMVHCHTPMGAVLARLVAKAHRKNRTKVFYTAHGFHFYKGAPLKNWLFFYPVERWLAKYTDVLITINKEDYACAKCFCHKKVTQVEYIPGVGVDTEKIARIAGAVDRDEKRRALGLGTEYFVLINAAELSQRKNQKVILEAVKELKENYGIEVTVLLCGRGPMQQSLENYVKEAGIEKQVKFLGYRTDVYELYAMADCFVFSSLQEGLPVALMEAMAAGLPVVCSRIRGNVDLVEDGENGYLVEATNSSQYAERIYKVMQQRAGSCGINQEKLKSYDMKKVIEYMRKVYRN